MTAEYVHRIIESTGPITEEPLLVRYRLAFQRYNVSFPDVLDIAVVLGLAVGRLYAVVLVIWSIRRERQALNQLLSVTVDGNVVVWKNVGECSQKKLSLPNSHLFDQ